MESATGRYVGCDRKIGLATRPEVERVSHGCPTSLRRQTGWRRVPIGTRESPLQGGTHADSSNCARSPRGHCNGRRGFRRTRDGVRDSHHSDELKVQVCKKYDGDRHTRFYFESWTQDYEDSYDFWLRKDRCQWYTLDYDENYFYLYEQDGSDYDVRYKVQGKKHWASVDHDGKLTVKFKDHDDPELKIWVYNYEDDDHH